MAFPFPDVPNVPGVPAVLRDFAQGAVDDLVMMAADLVNLFAGAGEPVWGLYQNGQPVISCDTVAAVGYREEWSISTYPVEDGAFESYNKVQSPSLVRLKFVTGGSVTDKQDFIESIANIIGTTDLFDVVTPEAIYTNVNPIRQDYDRTAIKGVGLLSIEVVCEQVRVTTSAAFTGGTGADASGATSSNTAATQNGSTATGEAQPYRGDNLGPLKPKTPSGASQVNVGTVQPVTPTASQSAAFQDMRGTGFDF